MSLIDRVRYLAGGITVQQSRAVVAEVYRRIGEGTLASTNPRDLASVLLAYANGLVQQNAADTISGVEPPLSLPADQLVDPDVERLCRAREALVATGYFTAEQVGDDIAARITELWSAMSSGGMLCGRCEHEMPYGVVHQHHAVIANACVGCAACSAGREVGWRP